MHRLTISGRFSTTGFEATVTVERAPESSSEAGNAEG